MQYSDEAILLTVAQAGKRTLVLEVLTANHGRARCVTALKPGERPTLLPGSFIELTLERVDLKKPLIATLGRITGGLISSGPTDVGVAALRSASDMLVALVPMQQPVPELYEAMAGLMASLVHEDGRWPVHYAAWEFALLEEVGCLDGLARCMPAFRHGELIYVSPRTGAIVTREEGGAFLDKLIPLPGFLLGGKANSLAAVRQGFELTAALLERFALPKADKEVVMPQPRKLLERAIKRMTLLAAEVQQTRPMEDAESRARRMESMQPLMVASASAR